MFPPGHFSPDARGLGDDAFVWEPSPGNIWVGTADASSEGTHFRLDWTTPARALRKALIANLSDINAMGGTARQVYFNLGANSAWGDEVYEALGRELQAMEAEYGFRVVGGDSVTVAGPAFFAFTVLGTVVGLPLLRSACRPGQKVYVSGELGGSAAGLALLGSERSGRGPAEKTLIESHLAPLPPLALGPVLASLGNPVAAIDISDGLSSEAWHLARRSGCALHLDAERIPMHSALRETGDPGARDFALHGGEDYQLLFTGDFDVATLARLEAVAPLHEIGIVEPGEGVLLREGGYSSQLEPRGFSHGD